MQEQVEHPGLVEAATAVLDALIDDEAVPELPAIESAHWAEAFLGAFRAFRHGQRGREAQAAAERLGRTAAADPYRFFWEFWQNADDAGATELRFEVRPDSLLITNNGRPFRTLEVFSLLTVGRSTKYGDDKTMGQWGVGSLSLMRFSARPVYNSGPWRFGLERSFTYPGPEEGDASEVPGLRVVAPLLAEVNASELAAGLQSLLREETLLYMEHLEKVTVSGPEGGEYSVEARVERSGAASRVELGEEVWLRFEEDLVPPAGLLRDGGRPAPESVHVVLARRARAATSPSQVYVFFPTQVTHGYPWRFSASLDVTTGREGLIDSAFNKWLLRQIGTTMVRASGHHLAGNQSAPWSLVPRSPEKHPLLAEVWSGALAEMTSSAWLPGGAKKMRAAQAAFPASDEIRAVVRAADLAALTQGSRRWLSGNPPPAAHDALLAAGAMRVSADEVASVLSQASKTRGPVWFLRAACAAVDAGPSADAIKVLLTEKCFLNARGTPFSLAVARRDGKVICNARSEVLSEELGDLFAKNLVVPLHKVYRVPDKKSDSEEDVLRRRLNDWLSEHSGDDTYDYESRFDAGAFIKLFVIEREAASAGGEVADRLLSFVRDHLESYVSEEGKGNRERAYAQLARALRVRAFQWGSNGRPSYSYRRLSEVTLAAAYLDRHSWPDAARGVPGIWWCDSRYRKTLVRGTDNPLSVNAFLLRLGAEDGPRLIDAKLDGWHGWHNYSSVGHGDEQRYPNFPHGAAKFGSFSAYGLTREVFSPELDAVLRHLPNLSPAERRRRGESLQRVFEEQWQPRFADSSETVAMGYFSNRAYELRRGVPTRWLWNVRHALWVERGTHGPGSPVKTYARMTSTVALLDAQLDEVADWDSRNESVAAALGFTTQVPAGVVVGYLREAKAGRRRISTSQARTYYSHLSHLVAGAPAAVGAIAVEGLIYCGDRSNAVWRGPEECLQRDARGTFGGFVGYLGPETYPDSGALWDSLGVRREPDLPFVLSLWERLSADGGADDKALRDVLPATYAAAEELLAGQSGRWDAAVLSVGGWTRSTSAFVTRSRELAEQLEHRGLRQWDNPYFELQPRLVRSLGVLDADSEGEFSVLPAESLPLSGEERRIQHGIAAFANEVHAAHPELWGLLRARLREAVEGRVRRLNPLRLRVALKHALFGTCNFDVSEAAYYRKGILFLAQLTRPSDAEVAAALLSRLALTGEQRWAVSRVLQLHLVTESDQDSAFPVDPDPDGSQYEDEDVFAAFGPEPSAPMKKKAKKTDGPRKPDPPLPPVGDYFVDTDSGEPGGADDGHGGLEPRQDADLRKPSGRGGGGGGGGGGRGETSSPAWTTTEQRGVELYRLHVLDPAGIEIRDLRYRPGTGADLIGSDNIYRELKTFSGPGPGNVPLTEHEYRRAGNQGDRYQLVVVEHVRGEAVITIITDPLRFLRYTPTGGVIVKEWRAKRARARVVTLKRGTNPDRSTPGSQSPSGKA